MVSPVPQSQANPEKGQVEASVERSMPRLRRCRRHRRSDLAKGAPGGQMVHSSADVRFVEPVKVPGGQGYCVLVTVRRGQ